MPTPITQLIDRLSGLGNTAGFDPYAPWNAFRRCPSGQHVIEAWRTDCEACHHGPPLERRARTIPPVHPAPPAEAELSLPPPFVPHEPTEPPPPRAAPPPIPVKPVIVALSEVPMRQAAGVSAAPGHATTAMRVEPGEVRMSGLMGATRAMSQLNGAAVLAADGLAHTRAIQLGAAVPGLETPEPVAVRVASTAPRRVTLEIELPTGRDQSQVLTLQDEDGSEVLTLVLGVNPSPVVGRAIRQERVTGDACASLGPVTIGLTSGGERP
ncbi:MAG: hypothetical protein H6739_17780 [Alphaproteobacteria bacterium]|nr:hypothetical protein [Alphaproteobacteria bacterium]